MLREFETNCKLKKYVPKYDWSRKGVWEETLVRLPSFAPELRFLMGQPLRAVLYSSDRPSYKC